MIEVAFDSVGVTIRGDLRTPGDADGPLPALVFTGPFTGVKDQVTGLYAARLAERGFVTLAFDHRNFGHSGGSRRQHEDPAGKLADLSAATSFLASHPAVDAEREPLVAALCEWGLDWCERTGARVLALDALAADTEQP